MAHTRLLAVTGGLLALALLVSAQAASAAPGTNVVQFTASGTGMVQLRGALNVHLTAHHPVMLVHDTAGDGAVSAPLKPGDVDFFGFRVYLSAQDAQITGSDVTVIVIGDDLSVRGTGHGWLYAKGEGTYRIGHAAANDWLASGSVAALAPSSLSGGMFVAHGAGVVAVRGSIRYEAGIGAGVLLVKDVAGNASVSVTGGIPAVEFLGFHAYPGATGATVTGTDVAVIAVGADVNVTASGTGWAYSQGVGVFAADRAPAKEWDLLGRFSELAR